MNLFEIVEETFRLEKKSLTKNAYNPLRTTVIQPVEHQKIYSGLLS